MTEGAREFESLGKMTVFLSDSLTVQAARKGPLNAKGK